ncbi:hypothetical protein [uncultured Gammaproteobacteria bacterium]|nr:hypothetical protein [uncultured Gammaproteobacteria bacterium]
MSRGCRSVGKGFVRDVKKGSVPIYPNIFLSIPFILKGSVPLFSYFLIFWKNGWFWFVWSGF